MYMPCNMKIKMLKFKLFIAEWFKMTFCSLKKSGSMMLLDLSFDHMVRKEARSHGVSVSGTIYVLYDGKIKKNLPENFNNCHIMLLIHLMKIIWTGGEKFQRFSHSYLTVLNDPWTTAFLRAAAQWQYVTISPTWKTSRHHICSYYLFHMVTLSL